MTEAPVLAFIIFGLVTQALLVGFFAARRWWPAAAARVCFCRRPVLQEQCLNGFN